MSALRFAIELAEATHGQITALHVVNMTPVYLESLDPHGYPAGSASILSELGRGLAFSILRGVVIAASKPKAALYYHVLRDIAGQYFPTDRQRQDGLCLR